MIPGLHTQVNVVGALLIRETRTRFGAHQLGYLWALISPLLMIAMFVGLMTLGGRSSPDGMSPAGFIATGLIPYMLFANTMGKVVPAINSNKALLYYPQVQPLDLVIARTLLEMATLLSIFILILGGDAFWNRSLDIHSLLLTVSGLLLAGALGATMGLVFCAASVFSNVAEQLHTPLFRPLFWISGIFFTANDLPTPMLNIVQYNPLLHAIELVRDGWYPSYTSRTCQPTYVIWWVLALAFVGLTLERMVRKRIQLA